LHLGEISLECSRPGAAAAALWATQRLLPLKKGGEFARGLERGRKAALALFEKLSADSRFVTAVRAGTGYCRICAESRERQRGFCSKPKKYSKLPRSAIYNLAVAELPAGFWEANLGAMKRDRETLTCLRSVLMKPEHLDWVEQIWNLLSLSADEILGARN